MILRKIISFLLILTTLFSLFSLSSCHKRKEIEPFTISDDFDPNKEYEITFWAKNEDNIAQRAVYAETVEKFQALYPNIKVTLRNFTNYGDIYNNVITNISTNTTPNVCITYPDHIATYATGSNVVVPLDALISHEKYGLGSDYLKFDAPSKDEIISPFFDEGKIGGIQYALPFMRSTEACYVNKTFVESLGFTLDEPLTWDFIWEVSEKAMSLGKTTVTDEKGKTQSVYVANGQKTLIPFIYKSTDNMMISMLKQLDAPYSNDQGEIMLFNETTQSILTEISTHTKSGAFSTFGISGYPANFLNAGQCIFAIDSTAGSTWMGAEAPFIDISDDKLIDFEIEVMPIPQFNTENPQMISQGPSLCIFNKEDKGEVIASWLFTQFLLTNEIQIAYSQTEGYIPVTSKAQNSNEYQDYLSRAGEDNDLYYAPKIESAKMLIENMDNTFTTPVFNGSASLRSAAGELVEDVTKSTKRKKNVDDKYISDLYRKTMSLYKLDRISKQELGNMPENSVILLASLAFVWLGLGTYSAVSYIKKRKNK